MMQAALAANSQVAPRFSRRQAIGVGALIDVTDTAARLGIKVPVAISSAAYEEAVAWTDADTQFTGIGQTEAARLADLLFVLQWSAKRYGDESEMPFQVRLVSRHMPRAHGPIMLPLKAVVGTGDDGQPCVTVLLPGET